MSTTTPAMDTTAATDVLTLEGIVKQFGSMRALDDVSIRVGRHEVVGLIGENGAGKSTLLKIIGGVHPHDGGQLRVQGSPAHLKSTADATSLGIGVVHQEQSLLTNLSVAENILMGQRGRGGQEERAMSTLGVHRWSRMNRSTREALHRVGLDIAPQTLVEDLTFADRQMVEIAKAVRTASSAAACPLLVLDEPTSVLERGETEVLEREIAALRDVGSVIFVSHRLEEVLRVCDRIYVLRHGKVVAERNRSNAREDELFELMTGREAATTRRPLTLENTGQTTLEVEGLSARGYFSDITFSVRAGQVCALVGTNGSGREELARALFGAVPFDAGHFRLAGRTFSSMSIRGAVKNGIGYLPSERKAEGIVAGLTLAENLVLAHPVDGQRGPLQRPGPSLAATQRWIERIDVRPPDPSADIGRLSGGNQQKIALGKWFLAPNLQVLVIDHPLRGLDPGAQESVADLIAEAATRGVAVVMIADTIEEALANGTHIVVMRDGQITKQYDVGEGSPTLTDIVAGMV